MEENPIHRQKAASYKEHMNILTCIHVYCADRRVDYVAKNRMTRFNSIFCILYSRSRKQGTCVVLCSQEGPKGHRPLLLDKH